MTQTTNSHVAELVEQLTLSHISPLWTQTFVLDARVEKRNNVAIRPIKKLHANQCFLAQHTPHTHINDR